MESREQLLNPFPWYRRMRESDSVHYDEQEHSWNVFRYRDVQRVLADYQTFSSRLTEEGDQPLDNSIINLDPPRQRQLRAVVAPAFTAQAIAQLAPRIGDIVHGLLDRVSARGMMDVIDDLARPLPVMVIAELLGIPDEERERFKRWSYRLVFEGGPVSAELYESFSSLVEERRRRPQDDLISLLLAASIEGEPLTYQELLGFCILLMVAGSVTTTLLIGNTFLCFDEYPTALERLYADRLLLPSVIEEVLRYRSPVRHMYRVCVSETTLSERRIRTGEFIVAWIGSANRDEAVFHDSESFKIGRLPNRHIAFGYGIHHCLGAMLARLEARIALAAMLERFAAMRVVHDGSVEPLGGILYGVNHVPITFERISDAPRP
jgi:cytochrome P450